MEFQGTALAVPFLRRSFRRLTLSPVLVLPPEEEAGCNPDDQQREQGIQDRPIVAIKKAQNPFAIPRGEVRDCEEAHAPAERESSQEAFSRMLQGAGSQYKRGHRDGWR